MLFIYVLYEAEKLVDDNMNKVNQSDSMFSVKGNFYKKKYQYLCICLFPEISAVIIRVCKI